MNREEQKEIRELKERLPKEIRFYRKEYDFYYQYGYLFRYEGDFLYNAIISIPSNRVGEISIATMIKPWILNETYWKIQQMDMEEMNSQPKSFNVRGSFVINDIYFNTESFPYDKEYFGSSVNRILSHFDDEILAHRKCLKDIHSIANGLEGYKVSNLTKAVIAIYDEDYEKALELLAIPDDSGDVYKHVQLKDGEGKSAKDFAIEFCHAKLKG